jgi:hypothetical protein
MTKLGSLRNEAGTVNQHCTMGADTISKNGRSSKSHKSRVNFLIIVCFALFVAGFIFNGCNKNDNDSNNDLQEFTVLDKTTLTQTVYNDETPATVTFETIGAWTSSIKEGTSQSTPAWISISPTSGDEAKEYTVTITLEPNATGSERSAVITFTCNGENVTVNITQKATNKDGTLYDPNTGKKGNVFVAGSVDGGIAVLWKNGIPQNLTSGASVSTANSLYVSGNNVYVAIFDNGIVKLWKNGETQNINRPGTHANCYSVFVSGNDVYMAGVRGPGNSV